MSAAYFGERWPSGICDEGYQVDTPVGHICLYCQEPVAERDQGTFTWLDGKQVPVHKECGLRSSQGGIGHWLDHSYWCLKVGDPDGGRTPRESALEVWDLLHQLGNRSDHA